MFSKKIKNEYVFSEKSGNNNDYQLIDVTELDGKTFIESSKIMSDGNSDIIIRNCEFNENLTITVNNSKPNLAIHIFESEIKGTLRITAHDHEVSIDKCNVKKLCVYDTNSSIDIFMSKIDYLYIEGNTLTKLSICDSDMDFMLSLNNKIETIDISPNSFISPSDLYYKLNEHYSPDKNSNNLRDTYTQDAIVQTFDLLLKNNSSLLCPLENSHLLYYRNKAQTKSLSSRCLLWLFGYFHKPERYIALSVILSSLVFTSLLLASTISTKSISTIMLMRLTINSFFGLSNTFNNDDSYLISIIISISIGLGTIFYSTLLITLINRFKIRT